MGALLVGGWFPPHFLPLFTTALRFGERPTVSQRKPTSSKTRGNSVLLDWLSYSSQVSNLGPFRRSRPTNCSCHKGTKWKMKPQRWLRFQSALNRFNPTFQTLLWSKPIIWQEIWIHFPSVTLSQTTCVTLDKSLKFFGFYQPFPPQKKN